MSRQHLTFAKSQSELNPFSGKMLTLHTSLGIIAICLFASCNSSPFLKTTSLLLGSPTEEDAKHVVDYTKNAKADSSADHEDFPDFDELDEIDEEIVEKENTKDPNLQNFEFIVHTVGNFIQKAPEEFQKLINLNFPPQPKSEKYVSNETESEKSEEKEELDDVTTEFIGLDLDDNEGMDDSKEIPNEQFNPILLTLVNSLKMGVEGVLSKFPKIATRSTDQMEMDSPSVNNQLLLAKENALAFFSRTVLMPLLSLWNVATNPGNREKRDVSSKSEIQQELFLEVIDRNIIDKFKFDSEVDALRAKIIFRETFKKFANVNLTSELSQETILRIGNLINLPKRRYEENDQNMSDHASEKLTEQAFNEKLIENGNIKLNSGRSESILILFIEIVASIAGLAWGSFNQIMWIVNNQ